MDSITIELFNQNDPVEFDKFRKEEFESLLVFCSEYIKDIDQVRHIMDEIFNAIFLIQEKKFNSYNELRQLLSVTANNTVYKYKQMGKI